MGVPVTWAVMSQLLRDLAGGYKTTRQGLAKLRPGPRAVSSLRCVTMPTHQEVNALASNTAQLPRIFGLTSTTGIWELALVRLVSVMYESVLNARLGTLLRAV